MASALTGAARLGAQNSPRSGANRQHSTCVWSELDVSLPCERRQGPPHNSLFWSAGALGRCVASEPLDSTASWVEVPEDHIVELRPGATRILPLAEVS